MTAIQQTLYHLDDFGNMLGRTRLDIRTLHVQRIKIGMHIGNQTLGQLITGFTVFCRSFDDLVVHIRDVTHEGQVITQIAQVTRHHIERHKGAAMADMTEIINGHPTHIHANLSCMDRLKFFFLSCQRVVNFQHRINTRLLVG